MLHHPSTPPDLLFGKIEWSGAQALQKKRLVDEIEAISEKELLAKSTGEQARYYAKKYKFEVPVIDTENKDIKRRVAKIPTQNRFGVMIDVEIPFTGDRVGFDIKPSFRNSSGRPRAEIGNGIIKFSLNGTHASGKDLQSKIDDISESIKKYLGPLAHKGRIYNAELEELATQVIEQRKEIISQGNALVADILAAK